MTTLLLIIIIIIIAHIDHSVAGTKHYLREILNKLNQ